MTDAIHNFHPQYSSYTQYSSGKFFIKKVAPAIKLFFICMRTFAYFINYLLKYVASLNVCGVELLCNF